MSGSGKKENYILEVSWGCPSDKYPVHGIFQFDQAKALHDIGEEIVFLSMDMRSLRRWRRWGINSFEKDGIPVYEFNFPYGPFSPRIKYRIQDKGFAHTMKTVSEKFGMPAYVHFHCVMEAISGMKWCMDRGIPYLITEHNSPVDEGEEVHARMCEAYRNASAVIVVSNALGKAIAEAYGCREYITIPNIVDMKKFAYSSSEESESDGPFIFLTAARIDHKKGYDILIRAFADLLAKHYPDPDTDGSMDESKCIPHLTILGDGAERQNTENLVRDLGITDHVTFKGAYVREQYAEELKHSDCFVLPSRTETFGMVYAEALAAGVPVIATRCGGPEDFINDSNGMLIPVDDAQGLSSAMLYMTEAIGKYSREDISRSCIELFSADRIAYKILDVIRSIIS